MTKKIGILRGREDNFPNMLVEAINHKGKGEVAADGTAEELLQRSGCDTLEDAFVKLIGTEEGLLA